MTAPTAALAACPFCGGAGELSDAECGIDGMPDNYRCARCRYCGCSLGYEPKEDAVLRWNRRCVATEIDFSRVQYVIEKLQDHAAKADQRRRARVGYTDGVMSHTAMLVSETVDLIRKLAAPAKATGAES